MCHTEKHQTLVRLAQLATKFNAQINCLPCWCTHSQASVRACLCCRPRLGKRERNQRSEFHITSACRRCSSRCVDFKSILSRAPTKNQTPFSSAFCNFLKLCWCLFPIYPTIFSAIHCFVNANHWTLSNSAKRAAKPIARCY